MTDTATTDTTFMRRVESERAHQQRQWGDGHDDTHTSADWGLIVLRYAGRLAETLEHYPKNYRIQGASFDSLEGTRDAAVKLAAVCAAISDRIDRALKETT